MYGQAEQDKFVLNVLNFEKNKFFLELGSRDYKRGNNTYILEDEYNWSGIMVEMRKQYEEEYKKFRQKSIHVMEDATKIDYKKLFLINNVPNNLGYLQIDLDANNSSTINALIKINEEIMDEFKFATITFEHDVYAGNHTKTRARSRKIFKEKGYFLVFADVNNGNNPYEDWYVHPDLVDMEYVLKLQDINKKNYKNHTITDTTICYKDIEYIKR